jgi:glycosyltransferase involved in cell wall biosynthesis
MPPTSVCVAICTFRRNQQLATLLEQLTRLEFDRVPVPALQVLVVDNAPEGGAAAVMDSRGWPWDVEHVHLGASSISAARNEVLDRARGRASLLALLDDDEVPTPRWLDELLAVHTETGADMVVGPVAPILPVGAPAWAEESGLYDLPVFADGAPLHEGITGNALLVVDRVEALGLRFEEQLGVAGGEDQVFFRTAVHRGADVRFAAAAIVHEPVPAERLTWRYLVRRELRKGNTLGLLDRGAPGWPPPHPWLRVAKASLWFARGMSRLVSGVVRGAALDRLVGAAQVSRAIGMVLGLAGRRFDLYASVGASAPTAVVVAAEDPRLQDAGHTQVLSGFLEHLRSRGHRVVLLVPTDKVGLLVGRAGDGVRTTELRSPAVVRVGGWVVARPRAALVYLAWRGFLAGPRWTQRPVDVVRTRARRRRTTDHVLGRPLTPTQGAWVAAQVDALQPEVVLFNTPFCVPSGVDLPATVRATYVIALDVLSERAAAFEALGYGVVPSGFTPVVEADAMRDVSRVIAIQWDDAARFTELLPHAEVIVVPVSIEAPPPSGRLPVAHRCLFVGSGSLHNVDGMKWFLEECWPLVRAQLPSAELHVIGTVCARLGAAVDGVVLRGTVDDLSVEYEAASAVVVPLRAGSGLKVKLVEALCHRAAVVTTSVGAQGLMAVAPQPFAVGDGTADFTASLLEVLTDEARRHELVWRAGALAPQFSPARAYAELDASLSASGVRSPI